jgi:hypothetical protein
MTPKWLRAAVVVSLLAMAPVLAGCIGTAQASAMEYHNEADAAAQRWDAGAQLVQIVGVEGRFPMASYAMGAFFGSAGAREDASSSDFERASDDEKVGDGKAEVWLYRYIASGRNMAYIVVLDREGDILREGEESSARDFPTPIGARWAVDSDAALEIAKAANDGLRKGIDAQNFGIVSVLRHDPGSTNAVWMIAGGGGDFNGGGGGFIEIDAANGKVLKSEGGYGTMQDFARAWG